MATNIEILINAISKTSAGVNRSIADLKRLRQSSDDAGTSLTRIKEFAIGDQLSRGITAFTNIMGQTIVKIAQTTELASNLNESVNKTGVVFGQSAREVLAWSQNTADALGQSQAQALEAAGTFGNLFTSIGLTRKESADMSTELVNLASDLASFNNIDPSVALEKLRSGLTGETEPLRTLGVFLNEATVQAKAMEMGLAATTKQLTEADKVTARYALILDQTVNAQGDFARTADSTANAQRRVNAQLEEYATRLGQAFEPVRREILVRLADILQRMAPYAENIMNQFALGLARGINQIVPVLSQLGQLIRFWLEPGSPPRLLPNLDKWGTGAAQAYIDGWSDVDFGAFSTLAGQISGLLSSSVSAGQISEGGLFGALTGSREALANAVNQFAASGSVTESAFQAIANSAGVAGRSVEELARTYFGLQQAQLASSRAQEELNAVQERYNNALNPLNDQLRAVQRQRQAIRDNQRLAELRGTINNPFASADERALAQLEMREIDLRQRQQAIEDERDTAIQAAQDKLAAAQAAQSVAQEQYNLAQANLQQEIEYNTILAQRQQYMAQVAAEAQRVADEARRAAEQARAEQERAIAEQQRMIQAQIREQEQLRQAQLSYNLATTDTAGKIAILKGELDRYNPSQVEYWNTLTQIASLEDQLARSRNEGGFALPEIPPLELPDLSAIEDVGEGFNVLAEAVGRAFDAIEGKGEFAKQTFEEQTQTMMDHVVVFSDDSEKKLDGWAQNVNEDFALIKAMATGDWNTMWEIIETKTRRMSALEEGNIEKHNNAILTNFIDNRGNIGRTWQETWDNQKDISEKSAAELFSDTTTWLNNTEEEYSKAGTSWMSALWTNFSAQWTSFTSWANSLTMPWSNWQLPSWLQRHSPSELEQALMGTAAAIKDIQQASNANSMFNGQMAAAAAGDVYNITIPQQFAPNADVGMARQGAQQGINDSVIMARRRRGR